MFLAVRSLLFQRGRYALIGLVIGCSRCSR